MKFCYHVFMDYPFCLFSVSSDSLLLSAELDNSKYRSLQQLVAVKGGSMAAMKAPQAVGMLKQKDALLSKKVRLLTTVSSFQIVSVNF